MRGLRRAGAVISRGSGALPAVAVAYVSWYGWFGIRVLSGNLTADPVVSAAAEVPGGGHGWVADLGPGVLLGVDGLVAALTAAVSLRRSAPRRGVIRAG